MANDSTIGVGFLFITPIVVVLLLHMCFFWANVCFLGVLCVFGAFSWHRCFLLCVVGDGGLLSVSFCYVTRVAK